MAIFSAILPDLIGHILNTSVMRLRLVRRIGTGAYGIVYLAHDIATPTSHPRYYAVKCMLRFERGSDLEAVQHREIAYHRSLANHPNIAKLRCVIEEQYYIYMVMDYYEGGDLFSAVIDRQRFCRSDVMVKSCFVQLLDAVQACHDQGIFHRDLKPENILCCSNDTRLFLSDFGLATQLELSNSFRCGSSFYMSPECIGTADGTPYYTRQSDVWSLGVILANMISGRNLWRIATQDDNGYCMYLHDSMSFLHQVLPMVSHDVVEVLTRILDPDPATRVTIPELRRMIFDMPTFFSPEDEYTEGLRLITETFSEPEVPIQVNVTPGIHLSHLDDSASTTAFVSLYIRTPSIEMTNSEFMNGAYSPSSSDEDSSPPTPISFVDRSLPYTHAALAAAKQEEGTFRRSDSESIRRSLREARVTRAMHRIVGALQRRTART